MIIERAQTSMATITTAQSRVLRLDPRDNVLVALTDLRQGERISFAGQEYALSSDVPAKQKFVTQDLAPGAEIIMYGVLVGKATQALCPGDLLSTRNIRHAAADFHETEKVARPWKPPDVSAWRSKSFAGYHRADGQVGTRNYWIVLPLVFCENRNLAVLKQAFEEELGFAAPQLYRRQVAELARLHREGKSDELKTFACNAVQPGTPSPKLFGNVDGIKFLMHQGGCGGTREDAHNLCGLLAGYIHHPNVAGATVLSLGCQNAQVPILLEQVKRRDPNCSKPVLIFEQQKSASEAAMLSQAIRETFLGLVEADKAERKPAPLSQLTLGLKCGGSDGFSGLSANPAIGLTDAMKSAGAAKKGGTSPVTAVLDYPEYSSVPGLNLQCTPGNDVECVTAQVGAGANLVLFTTGLGTPTGNPIAPVLKISTNSNLARRMLDIIDIDCGGIISGETTIEQMGETILDRAVQVASGEARTKAEMLSQDDFIPWKRGVSL